MGQLPSRDELVKGIRTSTKSVQQNTSGSESRPKKKKKKGGARSPTGGESWVSESRTRYSSPHSTQVEENDQEWNEAIAIGDQNVAVKYKVLTQKAKNASRLAKVANTWHIWAFTIMCVVDGDFEGWSFGLEYGFGPFLIACVLAASAYILLTQAMAEMVSAMPFSGGSYGFTRVTLGSVWGSLVGFAEAFNNMVLCSYAYLQIAPTLSAFTADQNSPTSVLQNDMMWYCILTVICVGPQLRSGRCMWHLFLAVSSLCVIIFIVWAIICFQLSGSNRLNFVENAVLLDPNWIPLNLTMMNDTDYEFSDQFVNGNASSVESGPTMYWFYGGGNGFIQVLPYAIWFYLGVEEGPFVSEETKNPRYTVPMGMRMGMYTLVALSVLLLFIGASLPVGGLSNLINENLPLNLGFELEWPNTVPYDQYVSLFAAPCFFTNISSGIYGYGRQMFALARAGLFPRFLSQTNRYGSPYASILFGTFIVLLVAIIIRTSAQFDFWTNVIFNAGILADLVMYIFILLAHIRMRTAFKHIQTYYSSYFGIWGSIYAIGFFLLGIASYIDYCFSSPGGWQCVTVVVATLAILMLYYAVYARFNLILSPEELFAVSCRITSATMLQTGIGWSYLLKWCEKEVSTESLHCWKDIDNMLTINNVPIKVGDFREISRAVYGNIQHAFHVHDYLRIYHSYIQDGAPYMVNIPGQLRNECANMADHFISLFQKNKKGTTPVQSPARESISTGFKLDDTSVPRRSMLTFHKKQPVTVNTNIDISTSANQNSDNHLSFHRNVANIPVYTQYEQTRIPEDMYVPLCVLLRKVQLELLALLDSDTIPRFKSSPQFTAYLRSDPIVFHREQHASLQHNDANIAKADISRNGGPTSPSLIHKKGSPLPATPARKVTSPKRTPLSLNPNNHTNPSFALPGTPLNLDSSPS